MERSEGLREVILSALTEWLDDHDSTHDDFADAVLAVITASGFVVVCRDDVAFVVGAIDENLSWSVYHATSRLRAALAPTDAGTKEGETT